MTLVQKQDACIFLHNWQTRRETTDKRRGWWSRPSAWGAARSSGTAQP